MAPIDGVILLKAAESGEVVRSRNHDREHRRSGSPVAAGVRQRTGPGQSASGRHGFAEHGLVSGKEVRRRSISFISSEAEFTPKQIQTKEERVKLVYRLKIEVDNTAHELKNNMPVDAEIAL